jgi:hypothetical protein
VGDIKDEASLGLILNKEALFCEVVFVVIYQRKRGEPTG